jgi:hypothetical protein
MSLSLGYESAASDIAFIQDPRCGADSAQPITVPCALTCRAYSEYSDADMCLIREGPPQFGERMSDATLIMAIVLLVIQQVMDLFDRVKNRAKR